MTGPVNSEAMLRQRLRLSFWLFLGVLAYGTIGYRVLEPGTSLMDCLYMTVITVTTVGYGEVITFSQGPLDRAFTITLIFAGMGIILYFVSNVTAFLIDGSLKEIFARKRMRKMINKLKGHYIVCGVGTMGGHVIEELVSTGRPAVVIDMSREQTGRLRTRYPGLGVIEGDASENEVLEEAGVSRASGIIVATDNDKDNLVITISARQLNPSIRIVARCGEVKHVEKLRRSGADSVVTSNYIGGLRMVSEMVRPSVVSFLDTMLRDRQKNYRIEESVIPDGSPLAGRRVSEVKKRVLLLALIPPGGDYVINPPDTREMEEGSTLVYMGSPQDRAGVEALLAGGQA